MRIALCLSGQPRNVRAGWDNLNSTIIQENSNLDIFVHTWWDESYVGTTFENAYAESLNKTDGPQVEGIMSSIVEEDTIEVIENLYNPREMCVEEPIESFPQSDYKLRRERAPIDMYKDWTERYFYNADSMYYSINKCNEIKRKIERSEQIIYDVVIRARFDSWISKKINFKYNILKKNTIYTFEQLPLMFHGTLYNNVYRYSDMDSQIRHRTYYVNDGFLFGKSKVMDVHAKAGENFDMVLRNSDVPYMPERLLRKYLEIKHINVNNLMNITHKMLRRND